MANNIYVWNGGSGTPPYDTWAKAAQTIAAGLAQAVAGDDLWMANDHSELNSVSDIVMNSPGTASNPCRIIAASRTGSTPPVEADLPTSAAPQLGTSGAHHVTFGSGYAYVYGIKFFAGSGTSLASIQFISGLAFGWILDNCSLALLGSASGARIAIGSSSVVAQYVAWLNNTRILFSSVNQSISLARGRFTWLNSPQFAVQNLAPNTLFTMNSNHGHQVRVRGVDLRAIGSGQFLVAAPTASDSEYEFDDCIIGSMGRGSLASLPTVWGAKVKFRRVDSVAHSYRYEEYQFSGLVQDETTIVRTGGASDGVQPLSWRIIVGAGTAASKRLMPVESPPLEIWNDLVGTLTVTVYGTWADVVLPKNTEIWMTVEFLGTINSPNVGPIGSFDGTQAFNILSPAADVAADSSTWSGGAGSVTPFKLTKTLAPDVAMKGRIRVRVYCAKQGTNFYIDPKVDIGVSVGKSYMLSGPFVNELSGGGGGRLVNRMVT